jgi:RhtB (resistance to homoserine/threonine) family protein
VQEGYLLEFFTIVIVHLLAVASPGPDFAVVVRQSVTFGRRTALWTSLGVGLGIFVHVAYSLLGIGLLISRSIVFFNMIKLAGALYLIYLGAKSLRASTYQTSANRPEVAHPAPAAGQAVRTGFLTNGLNPKATLFFLSLFSVVISRETPIIIQAGYGLYMAAATAAWFSGIAMLFGHRRVRNGFQRIGHWFERHMGAVLIGLGLMIAASGN